MADERAKEGQGPQATGAPEGARPVAGRGEKAKVNPALPFLNEILGLVSPPEGPPKVDNPKLGKLAEGVFDDARLQKHTPQKLEDAISEGDRLAKAAEVPKGQWDLLKAIFAKEKERLAPSLPVQKKPLAVSPPPEQVVTEAGPKAMPPFQTELEILTTSVGGLKPSVDNPELVKLAQEASQSGLTAKNLADLINGGNALLRAQMVPEDQWQVLKEILEREEVKRLQEQAGQAPAAERQVRRKGTERTPPPETPPSQIETRLIGNLPIGEVERQLASLNAKRRDPTLLEDERQQVLGRMALLKERREKLLGVGKRQASVVKRLIESGRITDSDLQTALKAVADAILDPELQEANMQVVRTTYERTWKGMLRKAKREAPLREAEALVSAAPPSTGIPEAERAAPPTGRLTPEEELQRLAQILGEGARARGPAGIDRLGGLLAGQYRFSEDMAERRREFSEKLEFLESSEYDFENMANYSTLSELISGLSQFTKETNELKRRDQTEVVRRRIEANQALISEFWARYSLHNYNNRFRGAPDIGTMLQYSSLVSPEKLQVLFRIPGVAEGFRTYEEKGFEFIASPAVRRDRIREEIAQRIEQRVRNGVRGEAAQKLAENLWYITGRAAYFDAYNPNQDRRLKGEGPYILARLFNFPEWIKTKKDIRKFWTTTKYGESLNLGIKDFWSEKWTDIQKAEGNRRIRRSLRVTPDSRGFVASLRNVPFEQLDLKNAIPETAFTGHYDGTNKSDACRPLMVNPITFLERPHKENFEKLWEVFGHLGGKKQEFFEGLTVAMIEFNRRRTLKIDLRNRLVICALVPGHRSYSEHEVKWEPWDSAKIRAVCEESINEGVLTREQAKRLEARYGAGLAVQTAKEQTSATLRAVPGAILDTVVAFFKAVFEIKR